MILKGLLHADGPLSEVHLDQYTTPVLILTGRTLPVRCACCFNRTLRVR